MAHFAIVDRNDNLVVAVIVVGNDKLTVDAVESEGKGIDWIRKWPGSDQWPEKQYYFIQTSYSASIRKNYAGVGYTWNSELGAFIPPQPEVNQVDEKGNELKGTWQLNTKTCQWQFITA